MTNEEFDYALKELRYWSRLHREDGVYLTPVDQVWASDAAIDDELRAKLMEGSSALEDIPDHLKDWHPGSNNQVLNLLHPSLYPLIYGRSHLLDIPTENPKRALELSHTVQNQGTLRIGRILMKANTESFRGIFVIII
jgi:Protein of unknown function (DUF4246)